MFYYTVYIILDYATSINDIVYRSLFSRKVSSDLVMIVCGLVLGTALWRIIGVFIVTSPIVTILVAMVTAFVPVVTTVVRLLFYVRSLPSIL